MKVLVGSINPVKIEAVQEAFSKYFSNVEVLSFEVESGVPNQPINDDTFRGAENRAKMLTKINLKQKLNADFFVGIEGGIYQQYNLWFAFGCMCVIDKNGNKSFGTSPHFQLPIEVSNRLLKGEELGEVMDEIMKKKNTKQNLGAIGFFTKGIINRKELYIPGLITALVPFNHPEMFFGEKNES